MKKTFYKIGIDLKIKKVDNDSQIKSKKILDEIPLAKSLNIGYYLITPLLVGIFFGFWLDKVLGTKPIFFLLLFSLGVVSSFYNLFKIVKEFK